jgi:hypothetical protein
VSSSAAHSNVLPLRGVAQIKYDSAAPAGQDLAPTTFPPMYLNNVY